MRLQPEVLHSEAERLGKDPVKVERAYQLLRILDGLRKNPKTEGKFSLRGGTALNLFRSNLPRVSQDIDLNYTGFADREACRQDMPVVNTGIEEVLKDLGFTRIQPPQSDREHTWAMEYDSALGKKEALSIDINYFNRVPLFPQEEATSVAICGFDATFPVLSNFDLVAGKFNALFTRGKTASRDIYDIYRILKQRLIDIDDPHFRIPFMVEIACHTPQAAVTDNLSNDRLYIERVQSKLQSVTYGTFLQEMRESLAKPAWEELAVSGTLTGDRFREIRTEVERACRKLLKFSPAEKEFVRALRNEGRIRADLLLRDERISEPVKADLSQRLQQNSYLQFVCRQFRDMAYQGRLAGVVFEKGADVPKIRYVDSPFQRRAKELGVNVEIDADDRVMIMQAMRKAQKKDSHLSREDAQDMAIRSIHTLRALRAKAEKQDERER